MTAERDGDADAVRRILLVDAADRLGSVAREMDGDAAHRLVELAFHETAGECVVLAREDHGVRRHFRRKVAAHAVGAIGVLLMAALFALVLLLRAIGFRRAAA